MSDYKRLVSYIYGYEQGEKRESAGFVKVNARSEECKIWIHMKGFYVHGQKPYRVYVFTRHKERLQGRFLGELQNRNGALEWNGVTRTDSLMESGLSLEESRGLYIEGEGRIFAAEWDDYPVDVENFESVKEFARQEEVVSEREEAKDEPAEEIKAEEIEAEEIKTEEIKAEEVKTEEIKAAEVSEVLDPRREQWAYLMKHFPMMQYQEGDALISGIRLNQRDLGKVPQEKWGFGNNSFLLHGFYQYRHLLLLRRQTKTAVQYLIGVPGVYGEREQMMAAMFGFQEFKVMKEPDVKNGSFGYWCRTLA